MTTELQQFAAFLRETQDVSLPELVRDVAAAGPNFARVQHDDLYEPVRETFLTIAHSIEEDDHNILVEYGRNLGLRRARDDFTVRELIGAAGAVRTHIWERLAVYMQGREPWSPELLRRMEDFIHAFVENYVSNVGDALERMRAELHARSDELDGQRAIVRELGAPTIPVHDGILVMPLVGDIDSERAMQMTESLLEAISHYQADIVIIDITGVPMVDTSVANYMLQAARAAHLIGAQVVLVGLGSRIAQTIVQLGVDLSAMTTLSTLQEGLAYAYRQRGIRLVR